MADSDMGRVFTTPLGFVAVNIEVVLIDIEDSAHYTTLIADYITDLKIGYNVFTYMHQGFIEYVDKGGLLENNRLIDPGVPLKLKFKFDMLDIGETYYSTKVETDKQSQAHSDTKVRINFINETAKLIHDFAMIRDGVQPDMSIGLYLRDILINRKFKTGLWKNGTTSFPEKHFWANSLAAIIEDIKTMDMRRDSGNLFTMFSDFDGKLHYMEISDLMKTVEGSAEQNVLWCASFGHDFGLGFMSAPQMVMSHTQFSVDIREMCEKAHGYKSFNFDIDTKLTVPVPGKEGRLAKDLFQGLPTVGGERTISEKMLSPANIHEYFAPYSNSDDRDIITKITEAVASRPMSFLNFFHNNSMCVRMGFFNPKFQIIDDNGCLNNGVRIKPIQEEPDKVGGIVGDWMVMGFTHYLHGTQFYTDVDLARAGK